MLTPRRALPFLTALIVAAAVIGGCGSSSDDSSAATEGDAAGEKVSVVATTTQLGDIVREIGGDAVDVHQILQPNTDPHEYEPRPQDVKSTSGAKVVVMNGDGLDAWVDELIRSSGAKATIVDAGQGRPVVLEGDEDHDHDHADGDDGDDDDHDHGDDDDHDHDHGDTDPHWWGDPTNVVAATKRIEAALITAAPDSRTEIEKAANDYRAKIEQTDREVKTCIAKVPAADRKLVTDHDAFGYFTARYDLKTIGTIIPAQTTQAQPSARDLTRLTRIIRREKVKAIFPESSVPPRLARAIARQTDANADNVLYADSLGPASSPGATYLGMLKANANAIVTGLSDGTESCD